MSAQWIYPQVHILTGIGQGRQQLHGIGRMHVIVAHAMDQQQVILQIGRIGSNRALFLSIGIVGKRRHVPLRINVII